MLRQVAEGVAAAHVLGIVHRDLTPQNLFHHRADGEDRWKVLDFGISGWAGVNSALTGKAIVGTPSYMSPEQALGAAVDPRADVFTLGSVAYRCLTGRPAFHGGAADSLYQIIHDMPIRPSSLVRVPVEVDLALALATAKAPEDRFDSPLELAEALAHAFRGTLEAGLAERARQVLERHPWRLADQAGERRPDRTHPAGVGGSR